MTDQGCILGQLVSPPLEAGNNRRGPKRSLMSNSKRLLMTIRFLQNFPNILVTCSLFSARFSLKWHLPRKAFLIPLLKMEPPSTLYFIFSLSNYFSCISPPLTPPPPRQHSPSFLICLHWNVRQDILFSVLLPPVPKAVPGT